MSGPSIALVDFGGTGVDPVSLVKAAHALQAQVQQQFSLPPPVGYGLSVARVRVCKPHEVGAMEWVLGLVGFLDQAGALGYHDRTPSGLPWMRICPPLDEQDGVRWETTASHELLETLADPELSTCSQAPDGAIWALEVCDAVETDSYSIFGVPLSNWCTPAWFAPPSGPNGIKYDWLGLCERPFEIRPGGYGQTWSPTEGWLEQNPSQLRAYRASSHNGRRDQRRKRLTFPALAVSKGP